MSDDQKFIAGDFISLDLPPERKYLLLYFVSEVQQAFIRYYLTFGKADNFCDHTGYPCSDRWVRNMRQKAERLIEAHKRAKENFDFATLATIEEGRYQA